MTRRETAIFACFTDAVVAPEPLLPPVRDTDAAAFLTTWLGHASKVNAAGVRALLVMLDLAPLAMGVRRPFRKLGKAQRIDYILRIEKHRSSPVRQAVKALKGISFLCYYGDDGVLKRLGYDADANLARGRALRAAEGRP